MSRNGLAGAHIVFHKMVSTPYNRDGKQQTVLVALLYKRTQDAPIHPGYWALFGGNVEAMDRDEKETLKREIIHEQELRVRGLSRRDYECLIQDSDHLIDVRAIRNDGEQLIRYLKAPLPKEMDSLQLGRNPKAQDRKVEGEGIGWFTEEEIQHMWVGPEDRRALSHFFQGKAGHPGIA